MGRIDVHGRCPQGPPTYLPDLPVGRGVGFVAFSYPKRQLTLTRSKVTHRMTFLTRPENKQQGNNC